MENFPQTAKDLILKNIAAALPEGVKMKPNFEPSYMPGRRRACLAPDGDFFKALHQENAHIVTGEIDTVTENGIWMKGSTSVEVDAIITATGLNMKLGGGVELTVDGAAVSWGKRVVCNGVMLDAVPNLVFMLGYTNEAWTLGADAAAMILVRVLGQMRRGQAASVTPRSPREASNETRRVWPLDSTYRRIADERLPVYGTKGPWGPKRLSSFVDYLHSRWGNVADGLEFQAAYS